MDLFGQALAYDQMARLAKLMKRSPGAYRSAARQQLLLLLAETRRPIDPILVGMNLTAIKAHKPPGFAWAAYLADLRLPWGKRRADEYIRTFEGGTTLLELREKKRASMRRSRARRANVVPGVPLNPLKKF